MENTLTILFQKMTLFSIPQRWLAKLDLNITYISIAIFVLHKIINIANFQLISESF